MGGGVCPPSSYPFLLLLLLAQGPVVSTAFRTSSRPHLAARVGFQKGAPLALGVPTITHIKLHGQEGDKFPPKRLRASLSGAGALVPVKGTPRGPLAEEILSPLPRVVPPHIERPVYAQQGASLFCENEDTHMPEPLTDSEICGLRAACKAARFVLDCCMSLLSPLPQQQQQQEQQQVVEDEGLVGNRFTWRGPPSGDTSLWPATWRAAAGRVGAACVSSGLPLSGLMLDYFCHQLTVALGAYPSPLNYKGFPRSCCVSVDEVLAHGIPTANPLQPGSLVSVDVTLFLDGFHGDCCSSAVYLPHQVAPLTGSSVNGTDAAAAAAAAAVERKQRLVDAARKATDRGIAVCREGAPLSLVGRAISSYLRSSGCFSPPPLCGHGIGRRFHQPPVIHHGDAFLSSGCMYKGLAFTVEPVVCPRETALEVADDQWTIRAVNKLPGAQFEETVLIGPDGPEILTRP